MKKLNLLIIFTAFFVAACFKQAEIPPLIFDGEANMTIAEFKQFHKLATAPKATLIEEDVIITGIVTSTDQYGSCYKEIFFQDATGGISLRIANSSYYGKYPIGQRIFVKAKDLYLGNYVSGNNTGYYQIGLFYGNNEKQLEYISANVENQHIFRSGIPETPPAPKIITKGSDLEEKDYHTLVKLTNCYFVEAGNGTKYYEERLILGGASNQKIRFNLGTDEVTARISEYNTFKNDTLPAGALNITGILTQFGSTKQFIIRSINDVVMLPPEKILQHYDMFTDPFSQGWTNKQITGETPWTYYPGSPGNMKVQVPSGTETQCMLISPKLNFSGEKDIAIFINYRLTVGSKENMQALYTIDGTHWNELAFIPETGAPKDALIKLDANIVTNSNLQIAFQYKTTNVYPICMIMNITFKANAF
jgi:hypothetical protein